MLRDTNTTITPDTALGKRLEAEALRKEAAALINLADALDEQATEQEGW